MVVGASWRRVVLSSLFVVTATPLGCDRGKASNGSGGSGPPKVQLTLDWKPEPEFGGFYAAREAGAFTRRGLDVEIKTAGAGAPTWQLVATGKTDFAVTAADQVLIAREQGADVVALFAVYQTSPQGVMAHRSRGFTKLEDVWNTPGVLAAENNTWLKFLRKRLGEPKVTITGYGGGVATFLARPDYAQQCFVFSEPVLARQKGADPQTFLVADAGYNPYTTVVITTGQTVREHPERVRAMVEACREGWRAYLDNPGPTNDLILQLNGDMTAATIGAMADAQKPLIETEETNRLGLGAMTAERWQTLAQQLVELGVIQKAPPAEQCFVAPEKPSVAATRP